MTTPDAIYFRNREKTERAKAAEATDPTVARMHHELADRYAVLAADPLANENWFVVE